MSFSSDRETIRSYIQEVFPNLLICGGTDAYYCDADRYVSLHYNGSGTYIADPRIINIETGEPASNNIPMYVEKGEVKIKNWYWTIIVNVPEEIMQLIRSPDKETRILGLAMAKNSEHEILEKNPP